MMLLSQSSQWRRHRTLCTTVLLLLSCLCRTKAQIGSTICACQPSVYRLTLSFDTLCDDASVAGPGIVETVCIPADAFGFGIEDYRPESITSIQFIELNRNQAALQQVTLSGPFVDGDVVVFDSVLAAPGVFINQEAMLPASIYANLRGVNAIGQNIQVIWTILFDGRCDLFPLLDIGMRQGWAIFVSLNRQLVYVRDFASHCPRFWHAAIRRILKYLHSRFVLLPILGTPTRLRFPQHPPRQPHHPLHQHHSQLLPNQRVSPLWILPQRVQRQVHPQFPPVCPRRNQPWGLP